MADGIPPVNKTETPPMTGSWSDRAGLDGGNLGIGPSKDNSSTRIDTNIRAKSLEKEKGKINAGTGVKSIFSDYHVVRISQNNGNYPVFENEESEKAENLNKRASRITDLINNPSGARIYKAGDFVYCARHGMPINRMITLRRFAYPVANNITDIGIQQEPDIARLVTYMDSTTNPISDVCKMTWRMNWKDLKSTIETVSLDGDSSGLSGFLGKVASFIDPTMAKQKWDGISDGYNPMYDDNKVYGPVDSIAMTKIRDIGLETTIDFDLTFDFELRSINGVNQKFAFMDLLSNVLLCTYNDGSFWGGMYKWTGRHVSPYIWNKIREYQGKSLEDFLRKGASTLRDAVSSFNKNDAVQILMNIASNAIASFLGGWLDKIGRASRPQMNSLLTGEPTGQWHLTIGNPMNPIMSIGNLVITETSFQFDENSEFGFDDIPERFKVNIKLCPAQPLDRSGIEQLFTGDGARIYWKPNQVKWSGNTEYSEKAVKNNFNELFKFLDDNSFKSAKVLSNKVLKTNYNTNGGEEAVDTAWTNTLNAAREIKARLG